MGTNRKIYLIFTYGKGGQVVEFARTVKGERLYYLATGRMYWIYRLLQTYERMEK